MSKRKLNLFSDLTSEVPEASIEKGVVKIVGILNGKGLATEMSCGGHAKVSGKDRAWVQLNPSSFKHYMKSGSQKMEKFLKVGEGKWYLSIDYFGYSHFSGLGRPRPRKKNLKRQLAIEMKVRIVLTTHGLNARTKTKGMLALERAAKKYL